MTQSQNGKLKLLNELVRLEHRLAKVGYPEEADRVKLWATEISKEVEEETGLTMRA